MINKFINSPVIPVLTFNDVNEALKVSEILLEENLTNLEITLRTPNSLSCIKAIIKEFPNVNVGAGTIVNINQLKEVKDIGCTFAVSPGFTKALVEKAKELDLFYLPGVSSPSEIIELLELGIKFQKFFHAKNSGGYDMLNAYKNIFPDVKFCPTGGIGKNDFKKYLELENVLCLGGSWMVNTKTMSFNDIREESRFISNELKI
ncbi:MAG: bifunctional 4-hydroxy-2-oxoglutarate aldolase/2-dehydro-3-deoxy-phosphogluconate aldolase [Campylobacteraceae bacterium]|nr:bifunctional 4-hydroxy-2-oxoglutarate aldolase/2-dehydro-3-deoxy-phosphogluconate aldolase [Campylobacteraceae bacterium]